MFERIMIEDIKSLNNYLGGVRIGEMITFGGRTKGKSKLNLVLLKERTSPSNITYGVNYDLLTIDELQDEKSKE